MITFEDYMQLLLTCVGVAAFGFIIDKTLLVLPELMKSLLKKVKNKSI